MFNTCLIHFSTR